MGCWYSCVDRGDNYRVLKVKIEIKIPLSTILAMGVDDTVNYLMDKGLDLAKDIRVYDLAGMFRVFEGEALPEQHSGFIKTCGGMVSIRKPWLEAVA